MSKIDNDIYDVTNDEQFENVDNNQLNLLDEYFADFENCNASMTDFPIPDWKSPHLLTDWQNLCLIIWMLSNFMATSKHCNHVGKKYLKNLPFQEEERYLLFSLMRNIDRRCKSNVIEKMNI